MHWSNYEHCDAVTTAAAASADEGTFVFVNRMAGYGVKPMLERPRDDACERRLLAGS
jgi:hypothetical protein